MKLAVKGNKGKKGKKELKSFMEPVKRGHWKKGGKKEALLSFISKRPCERKTEEKRGF